MIKELKGQLLTQDLLLQLQASITHGTLKDASYEGKFRDTNDVVVADRMTGEVVHTPPDYAKIPLLIQDLCDFANDKEEFVHPIVKASILHFLIGFIHPFIDGNGRSGRFIWLWLRFKHGFGYSFVESQTKHELYYPQFDKFNWTDWINSLK
jgi:Fic family protein